MIQHVHCLCPYVLCPHSHVIHAAQIVVVQMLDQKRTPLSEGRVQLETFFKWKSIALSFHLFE